MARAPFNVVVYLHRQSTAGEIEYAVFQRADAGFWQGVSGGGEDEETPLQAAMRETMEEAGIMLDSGWFQLQTVTSVPVTEYSAVWDESLYVIPIHYFAVSVDQQEIVPSHEHHQALWLTYAKAYDCLKFEADRIALWELNQRLSEKGPRE